MSAYETIRVVQDAGVVRVVLNRPDRRNAISRQLQQELIEAVESAARDIYDRLYDVSRGDFDPVSFPAHSCAIAHPDVEAFTACFCDR